MEIVAIYSDKIETHRLAVSENYRVVNVKNRWYI
jgi:hypothetical protein